MPEHFHFITPLWLLALAPLSLLAWRVHRPGGSDNAWRRVVDARLLPLLMMGRAQQVNRTALWLVAIGWIIAVLALANPTWERAQRPVYQTTSSRVVVLDLSSSMEATDLKPSRLARARYKIEDVLALGGEGQVGLVVYAGDAFTVSPLTRDVNTIRALLPALEPGIMPTQGARADLGLLRAGELMRQAGASSGQVVLIADGIAADNVDASERAVAHLLAAGYHVSVIGVGADDEIPSTNAPGARTSDASGKPANSSPGTAALRSLARAGAGAYQPITANAAALRTLLDDHRLLRAEATRQADATTQGWKEQGPLLAVLLLPLAALAFRRNWLLGVVLLVGLTSPPRTAMASAWDDLWRRPDQQAARALDAGDYAKASELATDPSRRGSAEYRRRNYQAAVDDFARATGADADYNRGNALAKLGRYRDAIAAYDKALSANPGSEDARANKASVEALLKQQPQAPQQASNASRDASPKDQNQSGGSAQTSAQSNAQPQPSNDGKAAQDGTSSGQGQPPGNEKKANGGSQNGEPSRQPGTDNPAQDAASGKGAGSLRSAGSRAAQPGAPENQFADAAKKLADRPADAAKDESNHAIAAAPGGEAGDQGQASENAKTTGHGGSSDLAQPLDSEERMAAEQWLRRIPDDPGGLLRRKFLYQYRERAQRAGGDGD